MVLISVALFPKIVWRTPRKWTKMKVVIFQHFWYFLVNLATEDKIISSQFTYGEEPFLKIWWFWFQWLYFPNYFEVLKKMEENESCYFPTFLIFSGTGEKKQKKKKKTLSDLTIFIDWNFDGFSIFPD